MRIRDADPSSDAAGCAAIYAPHVVSGATSFETTAPDRDAFAERIEDISKAYPFIVADVNGTVVGYAYAGPHRSRAAYRWAVETSVYVGPGHQGRGVGRTLYRALLDLLRQQGLWTACAGITLPNPASVALHERCGFQPVGVYRDIGWKDGAWRDVGWWQLALREPADNLRADPPADPGSPPRLNG